MVRPVELQDTLGKTPAVERITQLQKANPENEQRQVMQSTGQKAQEAQRRPVPATHTDEVVLHRERQKEEKKKQEGEKDKQEKQATIDEHGAAADDDESQGDDDERQIPPPVLDITI
jgi:hypothetical protein